MSPISSDFARTTLVPSDEQPSLSSLPTSHLKVESDQEAGFIAEARGLIETTEAPVVSFDFFDTLAFRDVPTPTFLFLLVGYRLAAEKLIPFSVSPSRFRALRIRAEERARCRLRDSTTASREVTLPEIYDAMPDWLLRPEVRRRAVAIERSIETQHCHPVIPVVRLTNLAKSLGKKVVVVSDTYMKNNDLRNMVKQWSERPEIDRIFTSSSFRTGKGEHLFSIVCKHMKIEPADLLHIGDNYVSDIERSLAFGAHGFHLPNGTKHLWDLYHEEFCRDGAEEAYLDTKRGDGGLMAMRCRAIQCGPTVEADPFWNFGAMVLGPVFSNFVDWIELQRRAFGLEAMLCVMREGQFIGHLLSLSADNAANLAYLSVSRRVGLQASLEHINPESLRQLIIGRSPPTLGEFIRLLGLGPNHVPQYRGRLMMALSDPQWVDEVLTSLTTNPDIVARISAHVRGVRRRLLRHLRSLLPSNAIASESASSRRVGVVDLGWNGTIQTYLQRLVDNEGYNIHFVGLYLMSTATVNERAFDGAEMYGFLVDGGLPAQDARTLLRTVEILEQSCSSTCGSTSGYDDLGNPELTFNQVSLAQRKQINAIQEGALAFRHNSLLNGIRYDPENTITILALRRILGRSVVCPSAWELEMFRDWEHDENLLAQDTENIMGTSLAPFVDYLTPSFLLNAPMSKIYWPFGFAAFHSRSLAAGMRMVREQGVEPELFCTELPGCATLYVDTGAGYHEIKSVSCSLERNTSGNTYICLEMECPGIRAFRFDPVSFSSVLRLDLIRLTMWIGATRDKSETVLDCTSLYHVATFFNMNAIDASTFRTTEDPQINFDLERMKVFDVRKIRIEAGFLALPCDSSNQKQSRTNLPIQNTYIYDKARSYIKKWVHRRLHVNEPE